MNPEYIVIVTERAHRSSIVCATIAYSQEEANQITSNWQDDFFYVQIVPCDYSMRDN